MYNSRHALVMTGSSQLYNTELSCKAWSVDCTVIEDNVPQMLHELWIWLKPVVKWTGQDVCVL
jgi:hypothetical protein